MISSLASNARGVGSIPGPTGAKILYALWPKPQNIKQKQYCNKFNEDFKKGSSLKKNSLKKKSTFPSAELGWLPASSQGRPDGSSEEHPLMSTALCEIFRCYFHGPDEPANHSLFLL